MSNDYYSILGIENSATKDEIKEAYLFLVKQLHPDKHQGKGMKIAEKKLKELNEAYDALLNGDEQYAQNNAKSNGCNQAEKNVCNTWISEIDGYTHTYKLVTSEQWKRIIRAKEITEGSVFLCYLDATQIEKPYPVNGSYFEIDTITPKSAAAKQEFSILGIGCQDIYTLGNSETGEMNLTFYREDLSVTGNCISLKRNWNEYADKFSSLLKLINGENKF